MAFLISIQSSLCGSYLCISLFILASESTHMSCFPFPKHYFVLLKQTLKLVSVTATLMI